MCVTGLEYICHQIADEVEINNQSNLDSHTEKFCFQGREKYLPFRKINPPFQYRKKKCLGHSGSIKTHFINFHQNSHQIPLTAVDFCVTCCILLKLVQRPESQTYPPSASHPCMALGKENNRLLFLQSVRTK